MLVLLLLGQLLAQLQKAVAVLTQEQCFIKQAPYYCDIGFWNVSSQKVLDSWHWEESWSWSKCNSFPDTPSFTPLKLWH